MPARRIHLDPIGGLAGDMFAAAVVDAMPALALPLLAMLRGLGLPDGVSARFDECRAGGLKGLRFVVEGAQELPQPGRAHAHRPHAAIRDWLQASPLPAGVRQHALGLFAVLARAEAAVHGIDPGQVAFHEVGGWDSVCDFVAAAFLLDAAGDARWSWSPLPLGGGRVRCAHGILPVPAPATARLLEGLRVIDDGVPGERVTPTGATILRYLLDLGRGAPDVAPDAEVLRGSGTGHGTRLLPGLPNIVRCLVFEPAQQAPQPGPIASLQFEIDDQSPEDLAVAIEHLRAVPGVLEIYQAPLFAKKGRMAVQLQLLLQAWALDEVCSACFAETTTLGIRLSHVQRRTLGRHQVEVAGDRRVRVKLASRPGGAATAKAEMDDLAAMTGHANREQARRQAEQLALEKDCE